jgi:flavin-dependent dehydrogenase
MNYDYDVLVAGGGPAGSSTANFLRQKNRSVLVLEREKFPRFHIGESMLPFSNDIWKELGVYELMDANYIHKPGARFIHEESGADFTYYFDTSIRPGRPYAFQVKRAEFDKMLLDKAASLGAVVREETKVEDVSFHGDGVIVKAVSDGKRFEVRAPMFVDATGRDAFIAGKRDLKIPDGMITTNVALHSMWRGVDRENGADSAAEGNIILGLFDGGWWWIIPFKGEDTSVGMVFEKDYTKINRGLRPEEMYHQAIDNLPHLKNFLRNATRFLEVGSQGNWSYRSKIFYGERLLMVGDSAAFVDPLFSTGVLFAITGAKFAAEHIDAALKDGNFSAERFAPYQDQCIAGMDIFKDLVHEFYSENLRKLLIQSGANPTMCSVITSILAGDVYKPSMWHSVVRNKGFSKLAEMGDHIPGARVRSSRQAKPSETSAE